MERHHHPRLLCRVEVLLAEDAGQRVPVVEAAHGGIAAEVVIEGAVLLDEDDHVLDVVEAAGPSRLGERAQHRVAEQRCAGDRATGLEQLASGEF